MNVPKSKVYPQRPRNKMHQRAGLEGNICIIQKAFGREKDVTEVAQLNLQYQVNLLPLNLYIKRSTWIYTPSYDKSSKKKNQTTQLLMF